MTRYEYTSMKSNQFLAVARARLAMSIRGDGFLALDAETRTIQSLEDGGWRLLSVVNDDAIFERALPELPAFGPEAARRHLGEALHALSREEHIPYPFSAVDDMRAAIADLRDAIAEAQATGGAR